MARRTERERGAALLTAMVAVAVLTAVATELAYSSRVSLQIAANARDELRASWQARGAVSLARMVLVFQQQIDESMPSGAGTAGTAATTAGTAATTTGTTGLAGLVQGLAGLAIPRIQLWRYVPVDSSIEGALFPPSEKFAKGASGLTSSTFTATIEDEGRKVNAQLEGLAQTGDRKLWQQVQSLYQLMCDARWDPLFDREDANGVRTTREDLLVRLRDWVDEGDVTSALRVDSGRGVNCGMIPSQPPFENAFGDENQLYDRGENRYRTKNARMDSLDELYLVAGIGDAFMAAFGDQLTVYLPRDAKRNVNELDRDRLVALARVIADPPNQPGLLDVNFPDRLSKAVFQTTAGGLFSITPSSFGALVEAAGVHVNANLVSGGNQNSPFTDRSVTYSIKAEGKAGAVTSTIDAVVRLGQTQLGAASPPQPSIIHWRED